MKFLAMHITNQKVCFDIFTVEYLQNIFMEHDRNILMIFWHKRKINNFDPYNILLVIAAYDCFCTPGSDIFSSIHVHL